MEEVFENGKEQPFVGADVFCLTENDVLQAIEETKKDVDGFRSGLEDENENFRRVAERALPKKEQDLQTLTRLSPREILAKIKGCYDRVVELTDTGLPKKEIITRIRAEFPDLFTYYTILRKEPWGYRLGQAIIDAKLESGD